MRRRGAGFGLILAVAGLPAHGQEPAADPLALIRAATGQGPAAEAAAATLRGLAPEALAPAADELARLAGRARGAALAARDARARALGRDVAARQKSAADDLRSAIQKLVRTYEKPQQPQVDDLVGRLRALVYDSVPADVLVRGTETAAAQWTLFRELATRAGRSPDDGPAPEAALDTATRDGLLKGWMSGGEIECYDALAAHADFLDPEESACIAATNRYRALLGLRPLKVKRELVLAARDHSADMVKLGFFSHTSPVKGKETFGARASKFGASAASENIAQGQRTGEGAFEGWYHSPGHHRNMIGSASTIGIGRFQTTWTEMFG